MADSVAQTGKKKDVRILLFQGLDVRGLDSASDDNADILQDLLHAHMPSTR